MKQRTILCTLLLTASLLVVQGCATTGKGPQAGSIEELLGQVKAAFEMANLDLFMQCLSPNFQHPEVGGKEEARLLLELGMEAGYIDDGQVKMRRAKTKMLPDGGASVYPIEFISPKGSVFVEFILKKEGGRWRIIGGNVDDV